MRRMNELQTEKEEIQQQASAEESHLTSTFLKRLDEVRSHPPFPLLATKGKGTTGAKARVRAGEHGKPPPASNPSHPS